MFHIFSFVICYYLHTFRQLFTHTQFLFHCCLLSFLRPLLSLSSLCARRVCVRCGQTVRRRCAANQNHKPSAHICFYFYASPARLSFGFYLRCGGAPPHRTESMKKALRLSDSAGEPMTDGISTADSFSFAFDNEILCRVARVRTCVRCYRNENPLHQNRSAANDQNERYSRMETPFPGRTDHGKRRNYQPRSGGHYGARRRSAHRCRTTNCVFVMASRSGRNEITVIIIFNLRSPSYANSDESSAPARPAVSRRQYCDAR